MKRKCVLMLILLISLLMVSLPGISEALMVDPSDYTGYRTADPSDPFHSIYATAGWGDGSFGYFKVSWFIDSDTSYPLPYRYIYTFNIPGTGQGLSHFIIEVSEGTTTDNFYLDPNYELQLHTEQQGNPGLLSDLYGIKIQASGASGLHYYEIYSNRMPMWGDLYAKDGVQPGTEIDVYARNFGLGVEPNLGNYPYINWIPVPDTQTVIPEPASLLLMLLGIIGLAGAGIKKKSD